MQKYKNKIDALFHQKLIMQLKCLQIMHIKYCKEEELDQKKILINQERKNHMKKYENKDQSKSEDVNENSDQRKVKQYDLIQKLKDEEKVQLKQKQEKEKQEKEKLEREKQEKLEKEKQRQNQSIGQVTQLAEGLFEIEEKYAQEENYDQDQINEDKQILLKLISEAFYKEQYDDYDRYSLQLKELNEKLIQIKPKIEIQQQKEISQPKQQLPTIQENENNDETYQEEQPKRISKFKQERLKLKK